MRTVLWRIVGLIGFLLAALGSIYLGSMVADRQSPIIYEGVRALSESVPQGGTIGVEFEVFRLRLCPGEAHRWLIDAKGAKHAIPSFTVGPRPLPGYTTYRRTITIPDAAAVGQATYQVDLIYTCNFLHVLGWPIVVTSPPVRFEVTPQSLLPLPPPPQLERNCRSPC